MRSQGPSSALILAMLLVLAGGCSRPANPFRFNPPPTTVEPVPTEGSTAGDRTVIVVAPFDDPTKAPVYADGVGWTMSDAVSRALLNDDRYDIWIEPGLGEEVTRIVVRHNYRRDEQADRLAALHERYPEVGFVITGKVTDFYHTAELPEGVSRWGLFGRRNEALVAVDLRIVDLRRSRVVGADHIKGTAGAGGRNPDDLYSGVALDSYMFWSTPLGRASKQAIGRIVNRAEHVVPAQFGNPTVDQWLTARSVRITETRGLAEGGEYYLGRVSGRGENRRWRPLLDSVDGGPVMVRINRVGRGSATGMLLGVPEGRSDVMGAVLRRTLPEPPEKREAFTAAEPTEEGAP